MEVFIAGLFALAMFLAMPLFDAAVVAVILNLPLSGSVRFLLIAAAFYAFWILMALNKQLEAQRRTARWARLIFITLHLRNEHDQLPPALERLQQDQQSDSDEKIEMWSSTILLLAIVAMTALLLQLGTFGEVGQGWLTEITNRISQRH